MNLRDSGNSEKLRDSHGACLPPPRGYYIKSNLWGEEILGTDGSHTGCTGEFQSFPDL